MFKHQDVTALVVSHRRATLQRADNIVVLKDSRVNAVGKLDAVLTASEEVPRLWRGEIDAGANVPSMIT